MIKMFGKIGINLVYRPGSGQYLKNNWQSQYSFLYITRGGAGKQAPCFSAAIKRIFHFWGLSLVRVERHVTLHLVEQTKSLKSVCLLKSHHFSIQLTQQACNRYVVLCCTGSCLQFLDPAQIIILVVPHVTKSDTMEWRCQFWSCRFLIFFLSSSLTYFW